MLSVVLIVLALKNKRLGVWINHQLSNPLRLLMFYVLSCLHVSGIQEEIQQKIKDEKMRIALEKMKLANVKKVC